MLNILENYLDPYSNDPLDEQTLKIEILTFFVYIKIRKKV